MLRKVYKTIVAKHRDAISFIVLFFFLLTFVVSRTIIYLNNSNIIPDSWMLNQNIRGVHVHHLAYGIIILTISGYLALVFKGKRFTHIVSVLYGIGLGLSYDEFGMWLLLQDNYFIRQSYDAVAIISIIFINIVYFKSLWKKIVLKLISLMFRFTHSHYAKAQRLRLRFQARAE